MSAALHITAFGLLAFISGTCFGVWVILSIIDAGWTVYTKKTK